jgi:pentose-5-phosphate-3-epimerase
MSRRNAVAGASLSAYDSIFGGTDEEVMSSEVAKEKVEGQIVEVPLNELHEFKNHPFRVIDDEKMAETVDSIKEYLPYVDMVLVMSVEPGFGSQPFMPIAIDKVKQLKELKEKFNYNYLINIDGGINLKTMPLVKDYLDVAVSGSYICNSDNPVEAAKKLKEI